MIKNNFFLKKKKKTKKKKKKKKEKVKQREIIRSNKNAMHKDIRSRIFNKLVEARKPAKRFTPKKKSFFGQLNLSILFL